MPSLALVLLLAHCQVPLPPAEFWRPPAKDPIIHISDTVGVARECWAHKSARFALGCHYTNWGEAREVVVIPQVDEWTSLGLQRCIFWHEALHITVQEMTGRPSTDHEGWRIPGGD